jgi:hypothetical protein
MTFKSLPITVREVKATEAVLERLYASAKLGLKGDALAYQAGLLPVEFRRLCQMDPIAEYAVGKGYADAEASMARVVQEAALSGDTKMAEFYLRHRAEWQATQKVQLDGVQSISITLALEQAQARVQSLSQDVEDAKMIEPRHRANGAEALTHQPMQEVSDGYRNSDTSAAQRVASLRP